MHAACHPVCLAEPRAGRRRAAKTAMMAITTNNSISVKAFLFIQYPFIMKLSLKNYTKNAAK
jgi:hypothetical protein